MNWTPERIVRETQTLSSLPTIYYQLSEAIENPATSNRDIERIIHTDSGLTARLLRIANSALFAFPSKIDAIGRAVSIIGTVQLRELALATSVIRMFDNIESDLVDMQSFWEHSIACAITARALAGYRREANPERFFVAGLLHDIGRVLMFIKMPKQSAETMQRARDSGELLFKVERELIGFDHASVGHTLLKQWKLPPHTVNAVRYHHRPALDSHYRDAAIVHLADIVANMLKYGSSGERLVPPLDTTAWDRLELPPSILTPTLEQLALQFEETRHILLPKAD